MFSKTLAHFTRSGKQLTPGTLIDFECVDWVQYWEHSQGTTFSLANNNDIQKSIQEISTFKYELLFCINLDFAQSIPSTLECWANIIRDWAGNSTRVTWLRKNPLSSLLPPDLETLVITSTSRLTSITGSKKTGKSELDQSSTLSIHYLYRSFIH